MKKIFLTFIFLGIKVSFAQSTYISQPNAVLGIDASLGYHDGYGTDLVNYGTDNYFKAFCQFDPNGLENKNRGMIKFDYSSIPSNSIIDSAFIELFAISPSLGLGGHNGNNSSILSIVTGNWLENTVTWANQPFANINNQININPSASSYQDFKIDITSFAQFHVANPTQNFGYLIQLTNELPNNPGRLIFYSSDGAPIGKAPRISIYYHDDKITSTANQNVLDFRLFPNPAQDECTLYLNEVNFENLELIICDETGKIIYQKHIIQNTVNLNLEDLASGVYFVRVYNVDKMYQKKLIVL